MITLRPLSTALMLVLVGVSAGSAQTPDAGLPVLKPQADSASLMQQVQKLRGTAKVDPDAKSHVDKLLAEGMALQNAGRRGEASRPLAHALTLLSGRTWDAKEEFAWSLALRT